MSYLELLIEKSGLPPRVKNYIENRISNDIPHGLFKDNINSFKWWRKIIQIIPKN